MRTWATYLREAPHCIGIPIFTNNEKFKSSNAIKSTICIDCTDYEWWVDGNLKPSLLSRRKVRMKNQSIKIFQNKGGVTPPKWKNFSDKFLDLKTGVLSMIFRKWGWVGKAVWNFSENSSVLVASPVLKQIHFSQERLYIRVSNLSFCASDTHQEMSYLPFLLYVL